MSTESVGRRHIDGALVQAREALTQLMANESALAAIERAAALLIHTFEAGGRVYACGNGGSMSDAIHFAEELTDSSASAGGVSLRRPSATLATSAAFRTISATTKCFLHHHACGRVRRPGPEVHIKVIHILIELVERHFFRRTTFSDNARDGGNSHAYQHPMIKAAEIRPLPSSKGKHPRGLGTPSRQELTSG